MGDEERIEKSNIYIKELKKFIGKEVTVVDANGLGYTGICRAFGFPYLNIIIMTENEKIIIRNVSTIKRKRTKGGEE